MKTTENMVLRHGLLTEEGTDEASSVNETGDISADREPDPKGHGSNAKIDQAWTKQREGGAGAASHPLIPKDPSIGLLVADDGVGKTSLFSGIAGAFSQAGKKVLYIAGEGDPKKDIEPLIKVAGGDMRHVVIIDCVVDHVDVQLDGMLEHAAIKPHLEDAACILIENLSSFEFESIKRHRIRARLKHGL